MTSVDDVDNIRKEVASKTGDPTLKRKIMSMSDDEIKGGIGHKIVEVRRYQEIGEAQKMFENIARDTPVTIDNGNGRSNQNEDEIQARKKLTKEDIDFVYETMAKEAKYDMLSLKQIFLGFMSGFTKLPIHHAVNSKDTGAGKTYILDHVSSFFPSKYLMIFSHMSDRALYHRSGPLVIADENGEITYLKPLLNKLKSEVEELNQNKKISKDNKNKRIEEIHDKIESLKMQAEKLIDLSNQIIVLQDTPQPALFDTLMTLLSQDGARDQIYSFTDKSSSGRLMERRNRLRGTPVLFTSQVIDDSKHTRFEEKNRRLVHITPDTSSSKIKEAKRLIGTKYGCIEDEYDDLVVSIFEKERAKEIVKIIIAKLKEHGKCFGSKKTGVKIPFHGAIMNAIPNDSVWQMTVAERTMKYLSIITKVNMDARPKLINEKTGAFYPISTFEDLKETMLLMQRIASGIRPYLVRWYNDVFVPAFEELDGEPNELKNDNGIVLVNEKCLGLTTGQLARKTQEVIGGSKIGTKEIRDKYLYPLINQGIIDQVRSEINGKENIYFPVDEEQPFSSIAEDGRLVIDDPSVYPSKNILQQSFETMSERNAREYGGVLYKLIDENGNEISIDELVERYFSNPENYFIHEQQGQRIYGNQLLDEYVNWTEDLGSPPSPLSDESSSSGIRSITPPLAFHSDGVSEELTSRIEELNKVHIHRIGQSDRWKCDKCKIKDDHHFMRIHQCSGINYG